MASAAIVTSVNSALWLVFALSPTIGSALIAALASIVNTVLLLRHEKNVDRRFDERRNVIVKGTPDNPETVIVTGEERRELEDPSRQPKTDRRSRRAEND